MPPAPDNRAFRCAAMKNFPAGMEVSAETPPHADSDGAGSAFCYFNNFPRLFAVTVIHNAHFQVFKISLRITFAAEKRNKKRNGSTINLKGSEVLGTVSTQMAVKSLVAKGDTVQDALAAMNPVGFYTCQMMAEKNCPIATTASRNSVLYASQTVISPRMGIP